MEATTKIDSKNTPMFRVLPSSDLTNNSIFVYKKWLRKDKTNHNSYNTGTRIYIYSDNVRNSLKISKYSNYEGQEWFRHIPEHSNIEMNGKDTNHIINCYKTRKHEYFHFTITSSWKQVLWHLILRPIQTHNL